jgi:hypothetical protein
MLNDSWAGRNPTRDVASIEEEEEEEKKKKKKKNMQETKNVKFTLEQTTKAERGR